jgi:prevent-host-death family protein
MRAVGLKVLKNQLSEYVRHAAAGETVLITDRSRVVAELVPPRSERSPIVADELLANAVREGLLRLPAPAAPLPARTPVAAWSEIAAELDLDREER